MCRGPLAYGQATAVSTRELMAQTLMRETRRLVRRGSAP